MKTPVWILGGLLAAGTFAGTALAEGDRQARADAQQDPSASWTVEGRVIEAGDDDLTISRSDQPNAEFNLRENTTVTIDGQDARAAELEPGTEVRVRFELQEDDTIAREVEAKRSAKPADRQ